MARETGLEPATSGVTGRRSNQLSYSRFGGGEALGRTALGVKRRTGRFAGKFLDVGFEGENGAGRFAAKIESARRRRNVGRWVRGENLVGGDGFEPPTLSV